MDEAVCLQSDIKEKMGEECLSNCKFQDPCENEVDVLYAPKYVKSEEVDAEYEPVETMRNGDFHIATEMGNITTVVMVDDIKLEEIDIKFEPFEDIRLSSNENEGTFAVTSNQICKELTKANNMFNLPSLEAPMYECNVCPYKTRWKCYLENHTLVHTGAPETTTCERDTSSYKTQRQETSQSNMFSDVFELRELSGGKFSKLSYQKRLEVKERGRPTPDLNIEIDGKSRGKTYKRQFSQDIYSRINWICGCKEKNALFCFPCVLFSNDSGNRVWTETGVRDLVHLKEKVKKHENCKTHISNQMRFALFGKANIQAQLDSAYWIEIRKHNEEVAKNKCILSKIVDCIKFCKAFELALRGHDESESIWGLINFSTELENALREHLTSATIFRGTSKNIQDDILDCILEVTHEEIVKEVNEAPFLAVIADETTDVSDKFRMVTVLRYITNDGDPVERFWSFLLPSKHDAETLSIGILSVIDQIVNDNEKLIAQSYDGAAVMSGERNGVQVRVREKYYDAHLVHCYAHQLNSVISKACSINPQVKLFFGNLEDIHAFFNRSPERVAVLNAIVRRNFPHVPTRWNFNIGTVNVVYEYKECIVECMERLEQESNTLTCKQASSIRRILQDTTFSFWLTFFQYVIPHVDVLCNQLGKRYIDPTEVKIAVSVFQQNINTVRDKIDCIISKIDYECDLSQAKRKRPNSSSQDHRLACIEVCDIIVYNVTKRFAFTSYLEAARLLHSEKFVDYFNKFPENELNVTCTAYSVLNKDRLKTELSVLYSNTKCRKLRGAVPFLKFLISNNLNEAMCETKKLLQILLTTPMITAEAERNFSTLKRIETFLRNSMSEDRLTALAMLSMEKKFISSISDFNEKVINKFTTLKDRLVSLNY